MSDLPGNYIDVVQSSPEWLEMRKGCATGSRIGDAVCLMAKQPKEGPPKYYKAREDYMYDIAVTRLTGIMPDRYVSRAMKYGIENEPLARAAYELEFDADVVAIGLCYHPNIDWFAASPDGLIGDDGVLEIKCPTSVVHLQYALSGIVPEDYIPQMKAEIACSGRKWCDFVSFDSRMPRELQLYVRRFEPDRSSLKEFEFEVEKFLSETDGLVETIKRMQKAGTLTCRDLADMKVGK